MAKYIALTRGILNVPSGEKVHVRIVEPGEVFDYSGRPGKWMQLVEPPKEVVIVPETGTAPTDEAGTGEGKTEEGGAAKNAAPTKSPGRTR